MEINEGDVNLGISMGSKNYSIQTRVVDSSGAGVNAESRRGLAFACDPLSELVWSPHKGLSNNSRTAAHNKVWGSRDDEDLFVDKAELGLKLPSPCDFDDRECNGKMGEAGNQEDLYCPHNLQITKHTPDLQPQQVPDDEATSAAHVESSETKSRICLYKEKGKEHALSDEDDIHESIKSCNSAGLLPSGIKRRGYGEDVMHVSKRIKNQIPLRCGSTSIHRPDSSFMKWISSMVRGFSDSNRKASSSFPMPLACSIDAQDSASLNMGFQTIFQSLYCKDMNIVNTIDEKENDSIEECKQLMVDDKKTLNDLCLSKQIVVCDREVSPILVSNQARDCVIPTESFGELMNYDAEKTSVEGTSDVPVKINFFGSLCVTRLCTKTPRSEKCQEITQETIGCSTSSPKLNLDNGMNLVFPINQKIWETRDDSQVNQKSSTNNTEVSVDLKSTGKVCSIVPCKKFGSSEGMASVFARRLDAFRHINPSENNVKKDHQKLPLYDINVSTHNTIEIFHAIRNLRLSRADILRWMNSDMSLSRLNGYFLRLRLKKLERGLEGACYYVACISAGDGRELISGCTSNKCIMVDVGGIKSCITSQYVSNHDFLEDEIRAWWRRAVDRGCRVPSIDELNSKFNNRTRLGF